MAQETPTPSFSVKPLGETPKKPAKKRRVNSREKIDSASAEQTAEINATLTSIYKEKGGALANMKKIEIKQAGSFMKYITIILIAAALLSAAAWAGFLRFPGSAPAGTSLALSISGPADFALGATTTYEISYQNTQTAGVTRATLNIYYPAGFVFISSSVPAQNAGKNEWNIGNLKAGEKGSLQITGKNFGLPNQPASWRVFLNYRPQNFNSDLQQAATFETSISSSPLSLSISGADQAIAGNAVKYAITIKNSDGPLPNGLEVAPIFPANFSLASSTPALPKNNRWQIPASSTSTSSTNSWTFSFAGSFSDSASSTPLAGELFISLGANLRYKIAEAALSTNLTKNDVGVSLTINGSSSDIDSYPGDTLNISVRLKNTSDKPLKNAEIKLTLDSPSQNRQSILDWKQITDQYDGDLIGQQLSDTLRRGQITWNSKKIPSLAILQPGQEAVIDVRLPIKSSSAFDLSGLKESAVMASVEADYTDQNGAAASLAGNPISINLNSDLKFEDRDSADTNAVGQERHAVSWVLSHNFHSLKNLTLSATAYGDVALSADGPAPAGDAVFDAAGKTIVWKIPEMPESVDVLALPFTITINKKNPSQNVLLSKVHIQATDAVTSSTLDFMGDGISL